MKGEGAKQYHLFDRVNNRAFDLGDGFDGVIWKGLSVARVLHITPVETLGTLMRHLAAHQRSDNGSLLVRTKGGLSYEQVCNVVGAAMRDAPAIHAFIRSATYDVELHEHTCCNDIVCPGERLVLSRFMGMSVEADPLDERMTELILQAQEELRTLVLKGWGHT